MYKTCIFVQFLKLCEEHTRPPFKTYNECQEALNVDYVYSLRQTNDTIRIKKTN